jgi:hypothetical protein
MKILGLLIVASFVLSGTAQAELIYGQVQAVQSQENKVTISPKASSSQDVPQNKLDLRIEDAVLQQNKTLNSLDEIGVGDHLIIEADKPATGNEWEVKSLLTQEEVQGMQSGQSSASGAGVGQSTGTGSMSGGDTGMGMGGDEGATQGSAGY